MKKFFKYCLVAILAVVCAVTFAACGATNVSGTTYTYDNVEMTYNTAGLSESEKNIMNATIEILGKTLKSSFGNSTLTFSEDGTVIYASNDSSADVYKYTQDGETVTMTTLEGDTEMMKFTASGSTLYYTYTETSTSRDVTIKVIFKQA
jgi:WD40 repeat protein